MLTNIFKNGVNMKYFYLVRDYNNRIIAIFTDEEDAMDYIHSIDPDWSCIEVAI